MNRRIIGKVDHYLPIARKNRPGICAMQRASGLIFLGILAVAAFRPALAAQTSSGQLMVSAEVVYNYHCNARIETPSSSAPVADIVMKNCTGQPLISGHGLAAALERSNKGHYTIRYQPHGRGVRGASAGTRYIEIVF